MARVCAPKSNSHKDDEAHVDGKAKNKACVYIDSCRRKQTHQAKQRGEHTVMNCHSTASARLFTNYYRSRYPPLQVDKHSVSKDSVRDGLLISPERHEVCVRARAAVSARGGARQGAGSSDQH